MQATGIIAEYNPFHKGHQLHIQLTRKQLEQPIIAVMSGSLVQRGEPAFADKWLRAQMAIKGGVNLVLELPTAFCLRSAQYFAEGGVRLLQATGIVSHISCGAENASINYRSLAQSMLTTTIQEQIHAYLQQGKSYAQACQLALNSSAIAQNTPNNILALEYAKALLATDIKQIIISRQGNNYNDAELAEISSATAIRQAYSKEQPIQKSQAWKSALPKDIAILIENNRKSIGYDEKQLWHLLAYSLRTCRPEQIKGYTSCTEGLEQLLLKAVNARSLEEALAILSTKRYSSSRIRRLLMQLLLAKPNEYYEQTAPAYIRVLAFDTIGAELLHIMKRTATLPVITKLGKNPFKGQSTAFCQQLELDIAASNITGLLRPEQQTFAQDFLSSPYFQN